MLRILDTYIGWSLKFRVLLLFDVWRNLIIFNILRSYFNIKFYSGSFTQYSRKSSDSRYSCECINMGEKKIFSSKTIDSYVDNHEMAVSEHQSRNFWRSTCSLINRALFALISRWGLLKVDELRPFTLQSRRFNFIDVLSLEMKDNIEEKLLTNKNT